MIKKFEQFVSENYKYRSINTKNINSKTFDFKSAVFGNKFEKNMTYYYIIDDLTKANDMMPSESMEIQFPENFELFYNQDSLNNANVKSFICEKLKIYNRDVEEDNGGLMYLLYKKGSEQYVCNLNKLTDESKIKVLEYIQNTF